MTLLPSLPMRSFLFCFFCSQNVKSLKWGISGYLVFDVLCVILHLFV